MASLMALGTSSTQRIEPMCRSPRGARCGKPLGRRSGIMGRRRAVGWAEGDGGAMGREGDNQPEIRDGSEGMAAQSLLPSLLKCPRDRVSPSDRMPIYEKSVEPSCVRRGTAYFVPATLEVE